MSVMSAVWGRVGTRRKGFTLVEMMAVVAAVVVMVIPRAAARSREAALRTQLRELQGAVDRCMAERGEVPELSGAVMGVQEGDPVWYQEGKRRLQLTGQSSWVSISGHGRTGGCWARATRPMHRRLGMGAQAMRCMVWCESGSGLLEGITQRP